MKRNKKPRNNKGQPHGLWELYFRRDLFYKGHYINGQEIGFWIDWYDDKYVKLFYAR